MDPQAREARAAGGQEIARVSAQVSGAACSDRAVSSGKSARSRASRLPDAAMNEAEHERRPSESGVSERRRNPKHARNGRR